jgi:alanine dehydrogenase
VTVFDRRAERLEAARALGANVTALYPFPSAVAEAVAGADLAVGAVLVAGARAPRVITREMVAAMAPGSVVADLSVDQGGCAETTRPTTWAEPTYLHQGVVHFAVTNMPGAVPRTASEALSAALVPRVLALAEPGWEAREPALARGVNLRGGAVVHPALPGM